MMLGKQSPQLFIGEPLLGLTMLSPWSDNILEFHEGGHLWPQFPAAWALRINTSRNSHVLQERKLREHGTHDLSHDPIHVSARSSIGFFPKAVILSFRIESNTASLTHAASTGLLDSSKARDVLCVMLPEAYAEAQLLSEVAGHKSSKETAMVALVAYARFAGNPVGIRHVVSFLGVAPHDILHALTQAGEDGVAEHVGD